MSSDIVTIPRKTLDALMKIINEEITRLRNELKTIIEELRLFEDKYGIQSSEFIKMMKEEEKWVLPEGSEPDAVEWEALLEQKKRLEKRLRELEELWHQLQGYSKL